MATHIPEQPTIPSTISLPTHRDAYYGGEWHAPKSGEYIQTNSPGTGESLGNVANCSAEDMDAAIRAAKQGFDEWRRVPPLDRARILKKVAQILRDNAGELAMIDAADCGNPVREMISDAASAAAQMEFFAGLVTEVKGASIPMGPDVVNFSVRQPRGVVGRIIPFNHPLMFCAAKSAAALATGNTVVVKPPEQAPLSALRFAELCGDFFPPGVFNVVPGGREAGARLAGHPDVALVALIGSAATGRSIMKAAAETVKPVLLELGGKNALIAYGDADPEEVAKGVIAGMNFGWCGQSCGSTSRAFIHESIYEDVLTLVVEKVSYFRPGIPTDPETTMGAIVSELQYNRVLSYLESAKDSGARLLCGGRRPSDPRLATGFYIEPSIYADCTPDMKIANEEIFGPVLSMFKWCDEKIMIGQVNAVEYGLTCSIWTNDLSVAHRAAIEVEAGFVWINETSKHFLGSPYGGFKQSGIGREECIEEMFAYTQEKNIHVRLRQVGRNGTDG
ncbi:MAG: aldehyde dehydrogenase family protein [Xanthobacteraceae bacterium]|nr:aldehyde dehydrogenase family protein [Xanthobacteraceae bacterium]